MAITVPKTKIVCTIGPASDSPEIIRELIANGMRGMARLIFLTGHIADMRKKFMPSEKLPEELSKPVAILQDLGGPKIRVGHISSIQGSGSKKYGQTFILTTQHVEGSAQRISVSYPLLNEEVNAGDRILLADGFLELRVRSVNGPEIYCEVVTGGVLTSHKGINLPTGTLRMPSMTGKDREDLQFGLSHDVDYIALSFVRTAEDIRNLKKIIKQEKKNTPVIAKIEKHEAIDNYDDILDAADAIMVARGDLGVEIPLEEVPGIQKRLIQKANSLGKPIITATQMLRSMVDSPRPTRAEASDVANAVIDGTDAVMLSEETATGNYPIQAVRYMIRIIAEAEKSYPHDRYLNMAPEKEISDSVTYAACVLADHLEASVILAPTQTGRTASHISRYRPKQPIIAYTSNQTTMRRLSLFRGIYPRLVQDFNDTDDIVEMIAKFSVDAGDMAKGDLAVITASQPVRSAGMTNMIRVRHVL